MSPRIDAQDWKLLSEKEKQALYCLICFGLWRQGKEVPATWHQVLFGAWISYTLPIQKAWFELRMLAREELAGLIVGVSLMLAYLVMLATRLNL